MSAPAKHATCEYPGCGTRARYLSIPQAYVHMERRPLTVPDHDAVVSTVETDTLFDSAQVGGAR